VSVSGLGDDGECWFMFGSIVTDVFWLEDDDDDDEDEDVDDDGVLDDDLIVFDCCCGFCIDDRWYFLRSK
jgi:hypothetical protein